MDENYQRRSSQRGKELEDNVAALLDEVGLPYEREYKVPSVGVTVDFRIPLSDFDLFIECKGGELRDTSRPGGRRTDNIKKAIADAALLKEEIPFCLYLLVWTFGPKEDSSSAAMLECASKRILDGWFTHNDPRLVDYLERARDQWIE